MIPTRAAKLIGGLATAATVALSLVAIISPAGAGAGVDSTTDPAVTGPALAKQLGITPIPWPDGSKGSSAEQGIVVNGTLYMNPECVSSPDDANVVLIQEVGAQIYCVKAGSTAEAWYLGQLLDNKVPSSEEQAAFAAFVQKQEAAA